MSKLHELAGTTLDHVTVDWRNGIARATFLPSRDDAESYALRASGVVRVDIARGAKASRKVKEVRTIAGSPARAEIAMESGETIRLEADEFAVDPTGG
jgi:hypothetical protein